MRQIVKQKGNIIKTQEVLAYLGPGPVEDGAGGGGGFTELRGSEEALANADEAVRWRGARFVTVLLRPRL